MTSKYQDSGTSTVAVTGVEVGDASGGVGGGGVDTGGVVDRSRSVGGGGGEEVGGGK